MAFTVNVLRGATTYTISDGNPFSIEMAELVGGASVRTIEESGPYQDGSTHLDDRLEPRTITLKINVVADSAAALDGHRDTLNSMFKPVKGVPIVLKITRDDGEVRQLDCYRTGPLDIALRPENKPGNLHRAVVQLRAPDPTYYDPTEASENFTPPAGLWYTGLATISEANVIEQVESPGTAQAWTNAGSITAGSPFSVVFKSAVGTSSYAGGVSAFQTTGPVGQWYFRTDPTEATGRVVGGAAFQVTQAEGAIMTAGTQDYFFVSNGGTLTAYRGTVSIGSDTAGSGYAVYGTANGTARWRSETNLDPDSVWPVDLPYAAAYNIALDSNQRAGLISAMSGTVNVGTAYSADIVYEGDIDSYPVITITGPINDPVITNATTGDVLDFTGGTVGTADVWTVDLRYGRKSALFGTTSVANYLSDDSDLSTFRLVADPLATGGTNTITVNSSDAGTAAVVTVSYYNRYLSY